MSKNIVPLLSILVLSACVSSGAKPYKHKVHGVGGMDNPYYASDIESCKDESYAKGVSVSGEIVKDKAILEQLEEEYNSWLKNEYVNALVNGKRLDVPEKYKGIDASRVERKSCLTVKGWRK